MGGVVMAEALLALWFTVILVGVLVRVAVDIASVFTLLVVAGVVLAFILL